MWARILFHALLFGVIAARPGLTHEFWIAPLTFQVDPGGRLQAHLKNGEEFSGSNQIYSDRRFTRFELWQNDATAPVDGRMGDVPALDMTPQEDGLLVIVHETTANSLTYATWEKFQAFADHKDFPDIAARHQARGLPQDGFRETYTRHVKALVAVGAGTGSDIATGMETEIVALANPYTDDLTSGLPVQVFYQNAPRADAQVEIFERADDGTVTISLTRTGSDGIASIPVRAGHDYMVDAVVLRPAASDSGAAWETLWAALTFRVP